MRNTSFVVPRVLFNALGPVYRSSPAPALRKIKVEAVLHALHQEGDINPLVIRPVAVSCALALGTVPTKLQLIRKSRHALVRCVRHSVSKEAVTNLFI